MLHVGILNTRAEFGTSVTLLAYQNHCCADFSLLIPAAVLGNGLPELQSVLRKWLLRSIPCVRVYAGQVVWCGVCSDFQRGAKREIEREEGRTEVTNK